jgi:hypothetical protein
MSIDFDAVSKDGKVHPFRGVACFAPIHSKRRFRDDTRGMDVESVEKFVYYVNGKDGGIIQTTPDEAKQFYSFLRNKLRWNRHLKEPLDAIMDGGITLSANLPGQFLVGLGTTLRYLHEYPHVPRTVLSMHKQGMPPKAAFYLGHVFRVDDDGEYYVSPTVDGHSLFGTLTLEGYKHFVFDMFKNVRRLKPWTVTGEYDGVTNLFDGSYDKQNTEITAALQENYSVDPWDEDFGRFKAEDLLSFYNNTLKPLEAK